MAAERKVAVITGASSGIGAATARALAQRGWRCVLLARSEDALQALATELDGEWERCDVGDRADVDAVAARVMERHPRIDLLLNNAGIPGRTRFLSADPDRIETVMRVNYLGSVWCLRAFLPALEEARGAVVNIVSVAGSVALPSSGPYAASKHAQLAFSRAVTGELAERGVRVHTISPGFVETPGFPQRGVLRGFLSRRVIEADDVARHVLDVLERGKRETFVPAWYRIAAVGQALLPGVVARAARRLSNARAAQ